MKSSIFTYTLLLFLIIVAAICLFNRESISFHYYMLRLEKAEKWGSIEKYQKGIEEISIAVMPLVIKNFKSGHSNMYQMQALTKGISQLNQNDAEVIFIDSLNNGNNSQIFWAIDGLSKIKSTRAINLVILFKEHSDPLIRKNVALFLGCVPYDKSLNLLKKMKEDKDSFVQWAANLSIENIKRQRRQRGDSWGLQNIKKKERLK